MYTTRYTSPLGEMTILADDQALYGLWFNDQKYFGAGYDLAAYPQGRSRQGQAAIDWLTQYFAGQNPDPSLLKLKLQTTPFRQKVYQALLTVPYGETVTYKQLSDQLQGAHPSQNLARAVGGAIAHNPIMLVIPCHRVVGTNGQLTGYSGGLARKKALLKLESAQ